MGRDVVRSQHVSKMCAVCGVDNPAGLKARFFELEGDELLGVFEPRDVNQGYPGRLHGGLASSLLDETIGRAVAIGDPTTFGVTLELTVRFRKPVPLDAPVRALARITQDNGRIFEGTGEILLPDGTSAVIASGKYMRLPISRIADGDFSQQWFADERELPDSVDL